MRISNRNNYNQDDNKQSKVQRYGVQQPQEPQRPIQEAEAHNRIRPDRPRTQRDFRQLNKGIHGIIQSIEGNRVTIRVINSSIFQVNDIVGLDCPEYIKIVRNKQIIRLHDLALGERITAKYLVNDLNRMTYTISNILSIEVY